MVAVRPKFSRWMPPLINTPPRAAAASPLTIETGVEITSAQGQAITSMVKALVNHIPQSPNPTRGGAMATTTAPTTTAGVYTREKRSTNVWEGARDAWASSTAWVIRARVVSSTNYVTRTSSSPFTLIEPAKTSAPGCLSTGMDSPVIGD